MQIENELDRLKYKQLLINQIVMKDWNGFSIEALEKILQAQENVLTRKAQPSYPPRPDNWMDDYLDFDNA